MYIYIHLYIYIHYSQKELTHFRLEMPLEYVVLSHFESRIHKDFYTTSSLCLLNLFKYFLIYILGKNVSKSFELYQVFMHSFLCQNFSILSYCILLMH